LQTQRIPEEIDLILVDGGINDFGVQNIFLTPYPQVIKGDTQEIISKNGGALLGRIKDLFKGKGHLTNVIVTGYYQILSEQSSKSEMIDFLKNINLFALLIELLELDKLRAFLVITLKTFQRQQMNHGNKL
jgi:hypothetical protein